jgi:hypothetical protein
MFVLGVLKLVEVESLVTNDGMTSLALLGGDEKV